MKICQRCRCPFTPYYIWVIKQMSTCCDLCSVRNMFDGLGMATPPDLLDRHTKHPTLTHEEFRRTLHP